MGANVIGERYDFDRFIICQRLWQDPAKYVLELYQVV